MTRLRMLGYEDEALNVLAALTGTTTDDPYVASEFTAIKDTVLEMSKGSFSDLFTMTEDRHLHRTVGNPLPIPLPNQGHAHSNPRRSSHTSTKCSNRSAVSISSPTTQQPSTKINSTSPVSFPASSPPAMALNTLPHRGSLSSRSRNLAVARS